MLQSRKELKQPDEFQRVVRTGFDRVHDWIKPLLIVLGAFLLAALGVTLYLERSKQTAEQGQTALFRAQSVLDEELKKLIPIPAPVASPAPEKAALPPEDVEFKKLDVAVTFPESVKAFQKVIDEHKGSAAAYQATLGLGDLFFKHGQAESAVSWFQKATQVANGDFEKAAAFLALGQSQEATSKCDEAVKTFDQGLAIKPSVFRGEAFLAKARCLKVLNKLDEAKAVYTQIETELPGTQYAESATQLKSLLQ